MRFQRILLPLLFLALVALPAVTAQNNQDEEEITRGVFVSSRAGGARQFNSSNASSSSSRPSTSSSRQPRSTATNRPPRTQQPRVTTTRPAEGRTSEVAAANSGASNAALPGGVGNTLVPSPGAVGLGYTLFKRAANGEAVRVDPATQFRAGDQIRIALEANIDGFLYVFHTENGQNPQMLFPDARLNNGDNRITAHALYEVPSSQEAQEHLRWFIFDATPATERLFIVVSRQPLPLVPIGAELVSYCRENRGPCPWRPVQAMWTQVSSEANARGVAMSRGKEFGQAQTAREREATRGATLTDAEPPPSFVRMNLAPEKNLLVTTIDLIHR